MSSDKEAEWKVPQKYINSAKIIGAELIRASGRLAGDIVKRVTDDPKTEAVILVNNHSTSNKWFRPLWGHLLCFVHGRIKMIKNGVQSETSPIYGSIFVYIGQNQSAFAEEFSKYGGIMKRANVNEY